MLIKERAGELIDRLGRIRGKEQHLLVQSTLKRAVLDLHGYGLCKLIGLSESRGDLFR